MNPQRTWYAYEQGKTLGMTGPDSGEIILDDEFAGSARMTLERSTYNAPFAITVVIYGFGDHTRFIADEPTAKHEVDAMKTALVGILNLVPSEDDPNPEMKYEAISDAIEAFVEQFP